MIPLASSLQTLLWGLNIAGSALVAWRVFSLGLHSRYRWFFVGMILTVTRSLILLPFSFKDPKYLAIWSWTQPIVWLLNCAIVGELYRLVLQRHRGIYSLGRWFFALAVIGTGLLSATWEWLVWGVAQNQMDVYFRVERGIRTALALFLLLLLLLVRWFPMTLTRNLVLHGCLFCVYHLSGVVGIYYRNVSGGEATQVFSVLNMAVALGCLLLWATLLSQKGEEETVQFSLRRDLVDEQRLIDQLNTINSTLLKAGGK